MKAAKKIQDAYNAYIKFGSALDEIGDLWDDESMTEDEMVASEKEWDDLYPKYTTAYSELLKLVMNATFCTMDTAKRMIHTEKFEQLMACTIIDPN